MSVVNNKTRLPKICRKCFYRRQLAHKGLKMYNGKSRIDSFCAYLYITDEKRGCTPTDNECAKFKPRKNIINEVTK